MTTIFKSNTKATQFISDIAGIVNPNYVFSADFVNQIYMTDGSAVAFEDIISYKKTTPSYDVVDKKLVNLGVDTPQFNSPKAADAGLWRNKATPTASILGSEQVKTSKSLPKLADWSGKFLLLQVWGKGTVKISGAIDIQPLFGDTATNSKCVIVKVSSTVSSNIDFTVVGDVSHYQAIMGTTDIKSLPTYLKPLPVPSTSSTIKAQQSVLDRINAATNGFTVILRHAMSSTGVGLSKVMGVFELSAPNSSISYFTNAGGSLALRLNNATSNITSYGLPELNFVDGQTFTTVFVCNKNSVIVYRDGKVLGSISTNIGDVWQNITLGNTVNYSVGVANEFEGLFKNLVIYDYPASADEAIELTKSFTW